MRPMRLRPRSLLLVPVALLAACGGATTSHQATSAPDRSLSAQAQAAPLETLQQPSASKASDGVASSKGATASKSRRAARSQAVRPPLITTGKQRPSKARGQFAGTRVNELKPSGASVLSPCTLVTRSEARAILGRPIAGLKKAAQGPTCIYRQQGSKRLVTVALQHGRVSAAQQRGKQVVRVNLRGHKAFCLKQGTLMMLVPLRDGQMLNVSAACPIAAQFASKALARLGG
jgi:hypothetical protein